MCVRICTASRAWCACTARRFGAYREFAMVNRKGARAALFHHGHCVILPLPPLRRRPTPYPSAKGDTHCCCLMGVALYRAQSTTEYHQARESGRASYLSGQFHCRCSSQKRLGYERGNRIPPAPRAPCCRRIHMSEDTRDQTNPWPCPRVDVPTRCC